VANTLIVQFQGERYGWGCYIQGDTKVASAASPADAIAKYLGYSSEDQPAWAPELSERLERDLREAPRYACTCCGYRTLLNPGNTTFCAVCGWGDDPDVERFASDAESGPNHIKPQ
jgi:Cysteine-rich CPCC